MSRIVGAILAGGASRRFGRDKAAIMLDGLLMITHVANRLERQVSDVAIVGSATDYGLPYPLLGDGEHAGKGPLAGLAAARPGLLTQRRNGF